MGRALTVALVIGAGLGAGSLLVTSSAPSANAANSALADEASVAALQDAAATAGALGMYRDDALTRYVVLVPADRADLFSLGALPSVSLPVVVKQSPFNAAGIARVQSRVDALFASSEPGETYLAYFDPKVGKVVVHTSANEAELADRLGNDWAMINYEPGGPRALGTRYSDTTPFWGGAEYIDQNGDFCTLGFTVTLGGVEKMVTAGHCIASNGWGVWSPGSLQTIGTYGSRHCSGGQDGALITGEDYSPRIYVGGASSSTGDLVKGAGNPFAGVDYWWSGAITNENPTTVISTTGSGSSECGNLTGLAIFQNTEKEHCAALNGDSGSPLYLKSGTSLYVRGLVIGKSGDLSVCNAEKWTVVASFLGGLVIETG
jgi:hypothetical protein